MNQTFLQTLAPYLDSEPPSLIGMPQVQLEAALTASTIDVGMCGLFITVARLQKYDFSNPFYFATGLQAVVAKNTYIPSTLTVLSSLANCIDIKAQLILIMIIVSVLVVGYVVLASELVFGPRDEIQMRDNFFEGAQDSIWYCFVMMSTVGFGDIVPKCTVSKFISILWMFLSLALMSLLYAVVINNFTASHLTTPRPVDNIQTQYDLAPFHINSTLQLSTVLGRLNASMCLDGMIARGNLGVGATLNTNLVKEIALLQQCQALADNPQGFQSLLNPARFGPGPAEFLTLLSGNLDVVVERPEVIQYYNNFYPQTSGLLQNVGNIFNNEGVGIGVRRGHPLLHRISLAVANVTRADWTVEDKIRSKWFGAPPPNNFDGNAYRKQARIPRPRPRARRGAARASRAKPGPVPEVCDICHSFLRDARAVKPIRVRKDLAQMSETSGHCLRPWSDSALYRPALEPC